MPKCPRHDRRMWRSRSNPLLYICTHKDEGGVYCDQTAPVELTTKERIAKYRYQPPEPFSN